MAKERLRQGQGTAGGSRPGTTADESTAEQSVVGVAAPDLSDRTETGVRFAMASELLHTALQRLRPEGGEPFDFPGLTGEPDTFDQRFRETLNNALEARRAALNDKSLWSKPGEIILGLFTALSPFSKNFLSVAIQAQSVRSSVEDWLTPDTGFEPLWIDLRRGTSFDHGT
jgi:hypothetical protein